MIDLSKDINSVVLSASSSKKKEEATTYADEHVEKQFTSEVIRLVLSDSNSEVKNDAVKW